MPCLRRLLQSVTYKSVSHQIKVSILQFKKPLYIYITLFVLYFWRNYCMVWHQLVSMVLWSWLISTWCITKCFKLWENVNKTWLYITWKLGGTMVILYHTIISPILTLMHIIDITSLTISYNLDMKSELDLILWDQIIYMLVTFLLKLKFPSYFIEFHE